MTEFALSRLPWAFALLLFSLLMIQRISLTRRCTSNMRAITKDLQRMLDGDTDEKLLLFTSEPHLIDLVGQINRLLESRQQMRADFRRAQYSSKQMLANISHDIKTPLTVILGYLEMIRLDAGQSMALLPRVEAQAQGVALLIDRFFTLAKLEAGDMPLDLCSLELCELCRQSLLEYYDLLTAHQMLVEISLPTTPLWVQSNAQALQRILSNFISNALRYGASGGYLALSLIQHEGGISIHVDDHGPGIPKIHQQAVFQRLYTMEDSRGGNGLGLAIAQALAQQLGGRIQLKSEPGILTRFTLTLPHTSPPPTQERKS